MTAMDPALRDKMPAHIALMLVDKNVEELEEWARRLAQMASEPSEDREVVLAWLEVILSGLGILQHRAKSQS